MSGLRSVEDFCLNPPGLETMYWWVPPPSPDPTPFQTPEVEGVLIQNHELHKPFYKPQKASQRHVRETCLVSARGRHGVCFSSEPSLLSCLSSELTDSQRRTPTRSLLCSWPLRFDLGTERFKGNCLPLEAPPTALPVLRGFLRKLWTGMRMGFGAQLSTCES